MLTANLKFNPGMLGDEELIQSFSIRQNYLGLIIEAIEGNTGSSNRHVLLVGPRGIGKTMLVRRVAAAIRQQKELKDTFYPLIFGEESYQVFSVGEFWLEALFHLADQTQERRWQRAYQELLQENDETRLRDRALAQLMDFADEQKKTDCACCRKFKYVN